MPYIAVTSSSVIIDWWDLEEMIYIYVKDIYSYIGENADNRDLFLKNKKFLTLRRLT